MARIQLMLEVHDGKYRARYESATEDVAEVDWEIAGTLASALVAVGRPRLLAIVAGMIHYHLGDDTQNPAEGELARAAEALIDYWREQDQEMAAAVAARNGR